MTQQGSRGKSQKQIYRYEYYHESGVMIFETRYFAQRYIDEVLRKDPDKYWTNFSIERDENADGFLICEKSYAKVPDWQKLTQEWLTTH